MNLLHVELQDIVYKYHGRKYEFQNKIVRHIVLKVLKEKSCHFGTNLLQIHTQHLTYPLFHLYRSSFL